MKTIDYWTKLKTCAAKGCLFFAAVLALLPFSVKAECLMGWDVSGSWGLKQGPTRVALKLRQNGTALTGTARYSWDGKYKPVMVIFGTSGNPGSVGGTVTGTVTGDNFNVQIVWDNKSTGIYSRKIGPQGKMEGTVQDRAQPKWTGTWFSESNMICKSPRF